MTCSCHKSMYIDRQHLSRKVGRENLGLKYETILKVWQDIFISAPSLSRSNAAMRLLNLILNSYGLLNHGRKVPPI